MNKGVDMSKLKKTYFSLLIFLLTNPLVMAQRSDPIGALNSAGRKGQKLIIALLPIAILGVAYSYKRGKSDAGSKAENVMIGTLLATTAFGWAYFFK